MNLGTVKRLPRNSQKCGRCLVHATVLIPKKIKIWPKIVDCVFHFVDIFPFISTQESNPLKMILESTTNISHDQELMEKRNEVEPRRSKRTKTSNWFGSIFLTYLLEDELHSFKETMSKPDMPLCKEFVDCGC
jgi:hypothetical protein